MLILDGRRHFGCDWATYWQGPSRQDAARLGIAIPPPDAVAPAPPAVARLNKNRWLANCPDCSGAEYVWLEQLLFLCQSCWNETIGHQWRRVTLPRNLAAIERLVSHRRLEHRNWEPGETLGDLRRDNRLHDLPED